MNYHETWNDWLVMHMLGNGMDVSLNLGEAPYSPFHVYHIFCYIGESLETLETLAAVEKDREVGAE